MIRVISTACSSGKDRDRSDCLRKMGENMNRLSIAILSMMVALSMASLCSAQEPDNDTVYKIIEGPMILADQSCWVDIHNVDEGGKAGELLGFTHLDSGVHDNFPILIRDIDPTTKKYLMEAHVDAGEKDKFEPNGQDEVMVRGWLEPGKIIRDQSDKWIMGDSISLGSCLDENSDGKCDCLYEGQDGTCAAVDGNSWGFVLLNEDEEKSCGSEHPDEPEYPYLSEEGGSFELNAVELNDIE